MTTLRELSDTFFTAIPADIVRCVDELVPKPVKCNGFQKVEDFMKVRCNPNAIAKFGTDYVLADANGVHIDMSVFSWNKFVANVFIDANNRMLYHNATQGIIQIDFDVLQTPVYLEIWALTLLDNNICVVGSRTYLYYFDYIKNTAMPLKIIVLPQQQICAIYDIIGFRESNNVVVSYFFNDEIALIDYVSGQVLCKTEARVEYWAMDYTDQLVVQTNIELRLYNSKLEMLGRYGMFPWLGPFIVDRKGYLHIADKTTDKIVKVKSF